MTVNDLRRQLRKLAPDVYDNEREVVIRIHELLRELYKIELVTTEEGRPEIIIVAGAEDIR